MSKWFRDYRDLANYFHPLCEDEQRSRCSVLRSCILCVSSNLKWKKQAFIDCKQLELKDFEKRKGAK